MISSDLEKQFLGHTFRTPQGEDYDIIGCYVTDSAGLVLVGLTVKNGKKMINTLRVVGGGLELVK